MERRRKGLARAGWHGLLGAGLLCGVLCGPLLAQMPAASGPEAVELKVNPAVALQTWEPDANAPYTLGRGDDITVNVAARPELNSKQVIGPDGMVSFPDVGAVKVDGMTRDQAAEAIAQKMSRYFTNVTVTVGVDRYTSNQVLLLGAVERPGEQSFDRPPTLLEVITRGGGVVGNSTRVTTRSDYQVGAVAQPSVIGVPERCAIYRGADKVLWVELKSLLDQGSQMANIHLMRDDIVYVPSPDERYISVMGQVEHPGALRLEAGMRLDKVLALTGGVTKEAGKDAKIQIISAATGQTRVVTYRQVLSPAPLDLTLHSGDIVFVPQSGLARFGYVLQQISPMVTVFTAAAIFTQ